MTVSEIIFDPEDQSEIRKAAVQLYSEIQGRLPSVPWLSGAGQQQAFLDTVNLITRAAAELAADRRSRDAIVFWTLAVLYANNKKFRIATTAAQRNSGMMEVSSVELTFVQWIGSETPPERVVTGSMLNWENRGSADMHKRVELAEMARAVATSAETTPSANALRAAAHESYEDGWVKAKNMGKTDEQARGIALVSVLFRRLQQDLPALTPSNSTIDVLTMEALPFKVLPKDEGEIAIAEYMVWREHPEQADEDILRTAFRTATEAICLQSGGAQFVQSLGTTSFPWVKLLAAAQR